MDKIDNHVKTVTIILEARDKTFANWLCLEKQRFTLLQGQNKT